MLTYRQRVAAWIKLDAQRRGEAAKLAAIAERLKARPTMAAESSYDAAIRVWSDTLAREIGRRSGVFSALHGKP